MENWQNNNFTLICLHFFIFPKADGPYITKQKKHQQQQFVQKLQND
jgi:hypothetical protein